MTLLDVMSPSASLRIFKMKPGRPPHSKLWSAGIAPAVQDRLFPPDEHIERCAIQHDAGEPDWTVADAAITAVATALDQA